MPDVVSVETPALLMFYVIFLLITGSRQWHRYLSAQTCLVGRIQRDAGCSIGRKTGCPDILRDFLHCSQANSVIVPR